MFEIQPISSIWQSMSVDQQRIIIDLLARLAIKVVLPVPVTQHQELSHEPHR